MATALITGSSRGIGAAIALRLAKVGFDIALNDLNEGMFENNDIAEKIREFGVKCEIFLADVSDYSQCEEMVGSVKEKFGGLDVLVNNAGITKDGLMARMSEEQYDKVIAVNQKSVFNMMKLAGKIMMKQRSGRIINMASVAGLYGNPGQINYSASKAAVIGMTKTVAKELGSRGVGVNAVAPGFIKTPMTDKRSAESYRHEALRPSGGDCRSSFFPCLRGFKLCYRTGYRDFRRAFDVIKKRKGMYI